MDATYHQLLAVMDGDVEARDQLLERLRPRMILWASSRMSPQLRARMTPEDVAQEILLSVHRSLEQFRGENAPAFRAWLFAAAENRIRDLAANANAIKRRVPDPEPRSQTSPSGRAMKAESIRLLQEAIARLPEDYRRVIQLRRIEERDTADVASRMDRSPNAVRILYCRAIKALRDEMGEDA